MICKIFMIFVCLISAAVSEPEQCRGHRLVNLDLKATPDGQLFYVEAKVGAPSRRRTFNLMLATNYASLWVKSTAINETRGYESVGRPNYDAIYDLLATPTTEPGYLFKLYTDFMQIGSEIVEDQEFAVANPTGVHVNDFYGQFDGMIGLANETRPIGMESFFERLHGNGQFDAYVYSLYINNSANIENDAPKGALVVGGVDSRYYRGDIVYADLYKDTRVLDGDKLGMRKTLVIFAIHLDWGRVSQEARDAMDTPSSSMTNSDGRFNLDLPPMRLRLDSSTKLFVGNKKVLDKIHVDFMGATLIGEKGFYVFKDCRLDNKPDIVFFVDQLEFKITPEEYVLEGEVENIRVCFSAFKPYLGPISRPWAHPIMVFGTKFLLKYYTVFDHQNDVVGFATPT